MNTSHLTWQFVGTAEALLKLSLPGHAPVAVSPPCALLDGRPVVLRSAGLSGPVTGVPGLRVTYEVQAPAGHPMVRYRFKLEAEPGHRFEFTPLPGASTLSYGQMVMTGGGKPTETRLTEVRFSEFDERIHSYRMAERPVRTDDPGARLMGPLLAWEAEGLAGLWAYEHGSQTPDAFLAFRLTRGDLTPRGVALEAVQGHPRPGQTLEPSRPWVSPWLQLGLVAGDLPSLRRAYRKFMAGGQSPHSDTRQPKLFYNTWNYQERSSQWEGKPYLAPMNNERMLAEIDVAARLGVEVFVLDVGWFTKTGDWKVDLGRFPDGLAAVRAKLKSHNMELGLWFNPGAAALSSRLATQRPDTRITWKGDLPGPWKIWETEESYNHCLVSDYAAEFTRRLIELNRELGVTYFKWDAVGQYGCDSPLHHHGDANTPADARAKAYSYEVPLALTRIADEVARACPGAIVDFDVTEDRRAVGLGFLAAGKYFLINNGPYHSSFDDKLVNGGGMGANVLAFPGPARPRFLRTPMDYDAWLPSTLFLSHYLAEGSEGSQIANLASMFLGQNGMWGDLLALTDERIAFWGEAVRRYKTVRHAITRAYPERTGDPGSSPEVIEKLDPETGCGLVSLFSSMAVPVSYVTRHAVKDEGWALGPVTVERLPDGRARLTFTPGEENPDGVFGRIGVEAALVLFGTTGERHEP